MSDFSDIIEGTKPTLVDFYATWCGPCKMQTPIIEQLKALVGNKANVIKVDIDRNLALAQEYRVQSVPTLMIFVHGEPVWRGVGVHTLEALESKLNEYIAQ